MIEETFGNISYNGGEGEKNPSKISGVSEVIRQHSGTVKVRGMICSMSQLYKMIHSVDVTCSRCEYNTVIKYSKPEFYVQNENKKCPTCKSSFSLRSNPDYVNAIVVELQDTDTFSEIERLPVILFDDDTNNIWVGEQVIITGQIYIAQNNNRKGGRFFSILYSKSIRYEKNQQLEITDMDVKAIERLSNKSDIIQKLVSITAPSVIGNNHVKEGLLLCVVSSGQDNRKKRDRIHALLVGPPELAKTQLLSEGVKLVPNSRLENGQSSSGKSLTAIVSKEDESYVLRLGPIPLAKGSVCGIDELTRMSLDDQEQFLGVMEEGQFTINKHGMNASILSPTVIIASANPINSKWKDGDGNIDLNEIAALKPVVDRFDLIFVFRSIRDEAAVREYTYKKSELEDKKTPDYYTYLRKHILYAKTITPKITEEAKHMLNEYYIKIAKNNGSPRILETLYRLAKARARLKLKKFVNAEDAEETMQFYNVNLLHYLCPIGIPHNPRDAAYNECVNILRETKSAILYEELIGAACKRNEQVGNYLGHKFKLNVNWKLRPILELLVNNSSIVCVQGKPVVLQWKDIAKGPCDSCEVNDE